MAGSRIKGITVEIDGNTTSLQKSLKGVDSSLRDTQNQLKDVNKLLKLDPSNVDLLKQKQKLLTDAVKDTKKRQEELKKALEESKNAGDTAAARDQQDRLQRELIETTHNLEDLEKQLDRCSPALESISAKTGEWSEKTRGMSTAAGVAAAGMLGMAYNAATTADDLLTMSNVTGFSVEELQKLQYASGFVDVSYETMTGSIQKLTKQMGSGNAAFEKLGVQIRNSDGSMRSAKDVWYDAIEALGGINNEAERDQLSMELFGKSAMEMAGIVDDGGESLRQLGEDAQETGNILSGEAVEKAVAFNDQIDELKAKASQAFLEAGASLADTLVPALEKLVEVVTGVLSWFGNLDGSTQAFILTILALVAAISPVLGLISTLTGLAAALNVSMLPMIATIGGIVLAIGALVAAGVWLYQNWDTVKQKAAELWQSLTEKFEAIRSAISEKVEAAKQKVSEVFDNIKTTIRDKIDSAKQTVEEKFNAIKEKIKEKIDGAKEAVRGAIEKIKGFFNFSWSLPSLKLPHFSITGSFSLNPPSVPHFGIDWYAKAMETPILLNGATIFGAMDGKLLGGGETGQEVILGLNKLREMSGDTNINIVINATPNQSEAEIARLVSRQIQNDIMRKKAVFG